MPRVLAHERRGAPHREVEGAHVLPALHEALLVEHPVGREGGLAVACAPGPLLGPPRAAPPGCGGACSASSLGARDHFQRLRRLRVRDVRALQVGGERARGHGRIAHAPFEEIPGERRLGEVQDVGTGIERVELREELAQAREVRRVLALAGRELKGREMHDGSHTVKDSGTWVIATTKGRRWTVDRSDSGCWIVGRSIVDAYYRLTTI